MHPPTPPHHPITPLPHHPTLIHLRSQLQQIWGYPDFRSPQAEIMQSLLDKQDTLVVMPTGGGKSICFQLPALMTTGLTIVISPLVALMEDQVQDLRQRQLPAALLHSELPPPHYEKILQQLDRQTLRLLYLSPETLLSPKVWQRLSHPQVLINGMILDEAHCLVQWGDSFRPAYRRLGVARSALVQAKPPGTQIPIAAFTATADPQSQQILKEVLHLQQPQVFLHSPYRSNLHLAVQTAWTPRDRRQRLLGFIRARSLQAGLVYVRTRADSETLAYWCNQQGCTTAAYHAGLTAADRRRIETAWLQGKLPFVICTNAFGMGINKPNVRWVIHFHAPLLLSEYVQEVGRAGRDGQPATALTLISEPTGWLDPTDRQRQHFFQTKLQQQQQTAQTLARRLPAQGEINTVRRHHPDAALALALLHSTGQLDWSTPFHYVIHSQGKPRSRSSYTAAPAMNRFLKTRQCRWQHLLHAFGFAEAASQLPRCGHCDRCQSGAKGLAIT